MSALVDRWQASGLSQNNFASQEGISLIKLRYWIKKHRKAENNESAFVQVQGFSGQGISIRYPQRSRCSLQSKSHWPNRPP